MTKRHTLITATVLALAAVGCSTEPATTEPTTPPTTQPATTTTETTTTTTTIPADEFATWLSTKVDTITGVGAMLDNIVANIDAGNFDAAADIAAEVGNTYLDLFIEAPETGTTLSNTGNLMLITCSTGYSASADAIRVADLDALDAATVTINECVALINETTAQL